MALLTMDPTVPEAPCFGFTNFSNQLAPWKCTVIFSAFSPLIVDYNGITCTHSTVRKVCHKYNSLFRVTDPFRENATRWLQGTPSSMSRDNSTLSLGPAAQAPPSGVTCCPLCTLAFVPWGHSGLRVILLSFQTFSGNRTGQMEDYAIQSSLCPEQMALPQLLKTGKRGAETEPQV